MFRSMCVLYLRGRAFRTGPVRTHRHTSVNPPDTVANIPWPDLEILERDLLELGAEARRRPDGCVVFPPCGHRPNSRCDSQRLIWAMLNGS